MKRQLLIDLAAVAAFSAMCVTCKADILPDTVGVMLGSVHTERWDATANRPWNDSNPGLYAQWGRVVAGTYYNSIRQQSVFAGYVYPVWSNLDVTVGAVTGYNGPDRTARAVSPMVVPSVHWNIAGNLDARVNLAIGVGHNAATAINFCLEWHRNLIR